jgi:DNA repair protein SbcD/Mre11
MPERDLHPDERALLDLLPEDGARMGNISARRTLGWEDERYERAKTALLGAGLVESGQGRGGTLGRRPGAADAPAPVRATAPAVAAPREVPPFEPEAAPAPFTARSRAETGSVKFVHVADIHLDSPLHGLERYEGAPVDVLRGATRRALENLVALCIDEGAQLLLIAGDLYDGDWHDYGTGLFFTTQMRRLRDAGVHVVVVRGNHDAESRITRSLRLPENVVVFGSGAAETRVLDDLGIAVHGRSYARRDTTEDLSASYPSPLPGLLNVGLLHTSTDGRPPHDPYAPCSPRDLAAKGYDYWALGHVHAREVVQQRPWIVFPGNLQGRHARETGAKGCTIVTVDGTEVREVEHRPVDVVRWIDLAVDVTGCATEADATERFEQALRREARAAGCDACAVRVRLRGTTRAHAALQRRLDAWQAEARSFANDVGPGAVWLEKILLETTPETDLAAIAARGGAIGELLAELGSIRETPERLEGLAGTLDELRRRLPPSAREGDDGLRLDAEFVRDALVDVAATLLPRLVEGEG